MLRYLALLFILLTALGSCSFSEQNQDEKEIKDIVYDLSRDFTWGDIDGIMERVHLDYRHNGIYASQLRELWLNRLAEYSLLSCDVSSVEIADGKATVFMTMNFQSGTDTYSYPEPETSGDASYFIRENGTWLLYGNQEFSLKHSK